MARRKPKLHYAIICDDIRTEVGNKFTLAGIYGQDLIVPKIPFSFPKLCCWLSFKDMMKGDSFAIELQDPSGKRVGKPVNGTIPGEGSGYIGFTMMAMFVPLEIKKEGKYELTMTVNKDKKNKHTLAFTVKTPPKAH